MICKRAVIGYTVGRGNTKKLSKVTAFLKKSFCLSVSKREKQIKVSKFGKMKFCR